MVVAVVVCLCVSMCVCVLGGAFRIAPSEWWRLHTKTECIQTMLILNADLLQGYLGILSISTINHMHYKMHAMLTGGIYR